MVIAPRVAQAQKLPGIQKSSVKAPADIKIDGKPTEWSKFEAYNNSNEFFYSISNDNNNLYLAVQASDHSVIAKIVANGMSFTIKKNDKTNKVVPFTITYPYIKPYPSVDRSLRTGKTFSDTELLAINNQISGQIKEIPITGAKGINDEKVSVYNDLGIKANGLVDNQKVYTIELAVPLKYIEQVIDAKGTFKYTLQINGENTTPKPGETVFTGVSLKPSTAPMSHDDDNFWLSPTHLEGVYTLAK